MNAFLHVWFFQAFVSCSVIGVSVGFCKRSFSQLLSRSEWVLVIVLSSQSQSSSSPSFASSSSLSDFCHSLLSKNNLPTYSIIDSKWMLESLYDSPCSKKCDLCGSPCRLDALSPLGLHYHFSFSCTRPNCEFRFVTDSSIPLSTSSSMSTGQFARDATSINKLFVLASQSGPIAYCDLSRFCCTLGLPLLSESYFVKLQKQQQPQL